MTSDPSDRIAVVTGASRGVGRGIAHELGLTGATVYVTGRTMEGRSEADGAPGSLAGTATLVDEAGGTGIPVQLDHANDDEVSALAERIRDEHGQLDILVNNVWGGYETYDVDVWQQPFWEQPLWRWDKMFDIGVRAHYVTARALVPLMLDAERPLIVGVSAGDGSRYLGDVQYDVAKTAMTRLCFALAAHLRDRGVASVCVWPGFTRTERVEMAEPPDLEDTHSARFVGRCVVALANDADVIERSGGAYKAGQLGLDYGFTDVDGSQPEPFVLEGMPEPP